MIAALFVQTGGVYFNLPDVDPWDEARDARLYAGPWPVVAHPPCQRWGRLAGFCAVRWGLEPGNDDGCFESALRSVRAFGGVLEHPYPSRAWSAYGIERPEPYRGWTLPDEHGGSSCVVEQVWFGHPARKPTLLYACGVRLPSLPIDRAPDSAVTARVVTDAHKGNGKQKLSHSGASTTPLPFRDLLLSIARSAGRAA